MAFAWWGWLCILVLPYLLYRWLCEIDQARYDNLVAKIDWKGGGG